MTGNMSPDRNWLFQPERYRVAFSCWNFAMLRASPPKAFMTTCPPYISSTCPFTWPRKACCSLKCFCDFFTTNVTKPTESGMMATATRVMTQLIVSIITSTPITVATEVTICVRLWLSVRFTVSTSLVMSESTSPWLVVSKYERGSLLIFAATSRRSRRVIFTDTPAMSQPCTKEKSDDRAYSPSTVSRIAPIAAKSMPPVPANRAMIPSNSFVVARPRVFGPRMEKTVEPAAMTMMPRMGSRYAPR